PTAAAMPALFLPDALPICASELVRRLEECRRLECIEVTSGSEAPGDVSYAAASTATTVTAPTPSQAGATQVATVVGEMTATTREARKSTRLNSSHVKSSYA